MITVVEVSMNVGLHENEIMPLLYGALQLLLIVLKWTLKKFMHCIYQLDSVQSVYCRVGL